MSNLRNWRKLAAISRKTQEHPENGQSQNTSVPRINKHYITQVSEEIENRVTKQLFQEFSRTESRILGGLSKLNEFLLNSEMGTLSRIVPGTSRNTGVENQQPTGDRSQNNRYPDMEPSIYQSRNSLQSDPQEASHMVTGVEEEIP